MTKQLLLLLTGLAALLSMPSCLINRDTQHDLRKMDTREVYDVRTVRVPMFLARPVAKIHLKNEDCSKELLKYVNRIRAIKVTLAVMRPGFDMPAFRAMVTKAPYQTWMNINAYGNLVYINAAEKNNSIRKINIVVAAKDNALVYAMIKCKLSPEELSGFINLVLSNEESMTGMMKAINSDAVKTVL